MTIDRRNLICGAAAIAGTALAAPLAARGRPFANSAGPRSRVIYVNDIAGDPDGLPATVHMALSTTSQLRGIVGTAAAFLPDEGPDAAVALAKEMLGLMRIRVPVHLGSQGKFGKDHTPRQSPGVQAIIDEAMRTDTSLPLYIAVGGGLTEVASAVKLEPKVAERARLVWIGGGSWPAGVTHEYNFMLDANAAQFLFNETQIPIWTIPQAVYATCVISLTELQAFVAPHGRIGRWLYETFVAFPAEFSRRIPKELNITLNTGETWTLGDNPLAVLTSLGDWVPEFNGRTIKYDRTGAGRFDEVICPMLNPDGTFTPREEGRKIRIYRDIDTRLMFGDFIAKLAMHYS